MRSLLWPLYPPLNLVRRIESMIRAETNPPATPVVSLDTSHITVPKPSVATATHLDINLAIANPSL